MRIFLLFALLIGSCGKPLPEGIFPPKKMEDVLYDVIRADELADFSGIMDSTYRTFGKRAALYDSIFHIHSINKEDYKKSFQYYQGRPDLLKIIFDSLYARTDVSKLDTAKKAIPKLDSIIKKPVIKEVIKPL